MGADYAHHITACPSVFLDLPPALQSVNEAEQKQLLLFAVLMCATKGLQISAKEGITIETQRFNSATISFVRKIFLLTYSKLQPTISETTNLNLHEVFDQILTI